MSKSNHEAVQKRVEAIDDKNVRAKERHLKQTLSHLSLDDDFDDLDLECHDRLHHKASLR
jgi:hypothetical protein